MPISRFSRWLRPAFIGILVLACGAGLVTLGRRAREQREAVDTIEALGGSVMYDFELRGSSAPPGPKWLRTYCGDDYFARVESVLFWDPQTSDRALDCLTNLHELKRVDLDGTQVTDAGMTRLEHLTKLRQLSLRDTQVSKQVKIELGKKLPQCWIR